MEAELKTFSNGLAALSLGETETAVALLWFLSRGTDNADHSAAELATLMHSLSLRGKINATRLADRLASHKDTVRGSQAGTFRIKLGSRSSLDETYSEFVSAPKPTIQSHIIPAEDFISTRRYLEALVLQINGAYQLGFYDACAVLCRRLMETLLIASFEKASKIAAITNDGEYASLSEIIGTTNSKKYIKLTRAAGRIMDQVKKIGDAAAHHPTYITKQTDIDDIKIDFRRLIAELMTLSGIEPSAA
jgi:hypothetical protein